LSGFFIERIMASSNFQKCLAFVLKYEGEKSDDPRDPGGKTTEGITQRTYDAFLDKKGIPRRDVFEIPDSDRDEIYRREFWDAVQGESLRPGEDLCLFDLAVNSGPHRALQIWDEAGAAQASLDEVIKKVCALRLSFLKELRTWRYFGTGWTRRVAACRSAALTMSGATSLQPDPIGAAAGSIGAVVMATAAAIHYLQNDPRGPVLALVIIATILFILCLFLSNQRAASAMPVLTPAERLKELLARREEINARITEIEAQLRASIDNMTGLLGKLHGHEEIK
jgi:lysozyme family protein